MCLLPYFQDIFNTHVEPWGFDFSITIIALNIILLIFFILELHFVRDVEWRNLPHSYLMVFLSMISALLSSTFFILSPHHWHCIYAPILAISFRVMSKTFNWALYIVRGQMVMESLDNIIISRLAKYAPHILGIQCVIMNALTVIFTKSSFDSNSCSITFPLWLLFLSAVFGEIFWGLGFLYIFAKAMSNTMSNVVRSMSAHIQEKTKNQIRHHIQIYFLQLISSIIFLSLVSLCICFETLILFEAELFFSNLFLFILFCRKVDMFKKACCNHSKREERVKRHMKASGPKFGNESNTESAGQNANMAARPRMRRESVRSNILISDQWKNRHQIKLNLHALKTPKSNGLNGTPNLIFHRNSTSVQNQMTTANLSRQILAKKQNSEPLEKKNANRESVFQRNSGSSFLFFDMIKENRPKMSQDDSMLDYRKKVSISGSRHMRTSSAIGLTISSRSSTAKSSETDSAKREMRIKQGYSFSVKCYKRFIHCPLCYEYYTDTNTNTECR